MSDLIKLAAVTVVFITNAAIPAWLLWVRRNDPPVTDPAEDAAQARYLEQWKQTHP